VRAPKDLLEAVARRKFFESTTICGAYTVVTLIQGEIVGVGFSRCSPKDKWDIALGHRIARGRALLDFVQKVHARRQKSIGSAAEVRDGSQEKEI